MKAALLLPAILGACATLAAAQGTYVYDQQSATEGSRPEGVMVVQANQPMGQSFTPSLAGVGFIRLWIDAPEVNGLASTVIVNLRTSSISGPLLATTAPVAVPDGARGYFEFLFTPEVPITAGQQYFFQPWVVSGDWIAVIGSTDDYLGGTAYAQGKSIFSSDLWFREGIIVPEPGTGAVLGLGLGLLTLTRRTKS